MHGIRFPVVVKLLPIEFEVLTSLEHVFHKVGNMADMSDRSSGLARCESASFESLTEFSANH
jgi:hypothetical protein